MYWFLVKYNSIQMSTFPLDNEVFTQRTKPRLCLNFTLLMLSNGIIKGNFIVYLQNKVCNHNTKAMLDGFKNRDFYFVFSISVIVNMVTFTHHLHDFFQRTHSCV